MRRISQQAAQAFFNRTNFKKNNTKVVGSTTVESTTVMYLHGNPIAKLTKEGTVLYCMHGFCTALTRERLKALGINIYQSNWKQLVDGKEIDPLTEYALLF